MEEINDSGVKNLQALRTERQALRMQLVSKEEDLKTHFTQIEELFAPIIRVIKFMGGRRKREQASKENRPGIVFNSLQGIVSTITERYAAKHKKRYRLFSMLGSFLGQGMATLLTNKEKKPVLRRDAE